MGKESKANLETDAKETSMNEGVVINGISFEPYNI